MPSLTILRGGAPYRNAGVLTGHEDARFEDVLEGACKAASTLRQTKPFW